MVRKGSPVRVRQRASCEGPAWTWFLWSRDDAAWQRESLGGNTWSNSVPDAASGQLAPGLLAASSSTTRRAHDEPGLGPGTTRSSARRFVSFCPTSMTVCAASNKEHDHAEHQHPT